MPIETKTTLHLAADFSAASEQQRLQDLIGRLSEARSSGAPASELLAIITASLDFARTHAQEEEVVMAAVCYPDLNEHRAAHEDFVHKLALYASRLQAADLSAASDAEMLLRQWLNEHFTDSDRRLHEFVIAFLLHRLHGGAYGETRDGTGVQIEQDRFRAIVEAAPNAILVVDEEGLISMVNSQVERMFGYNRKELLCQPVELLIPERFRGHHAGLRKGYSLSPVVRSMGAGRELFGLRKDGTEVPVEIGLSPLQTAADRFVLASIIDISKRKEAEQLMRVAEANTLRDSILRSLPASVVATDSEGIIVAINPAAERLLGYRRDELIGQSTMLIHDQDEIRQRAIDLSSQSGLNIPADFQVIVAAGSRDVPDEREWTYCRKDGSRLPVHIAITTLCDSAGKVIGFLTVSADITARKRAEQSLVHMASHDALTGLPNRILLADRLRMAIRQARRNKLQVAVLLLDLDQFKQVNDSLGHQVGDELLVAIAKRLQDSVREIDTVARLGGDEFVVVVTDVGDKDDLTPLIGQISKAVSQPLRLQLHQLHVTPSIGVCLYPKDGQDPATLLKKADAAMYQAKASGRGTFKWFTEEMLLESHEKLVLANGLRQAEELDEHSVHYQPKVSLRTGQIVGTEALLRWKHGKKGDITPSRFIPIAEDTGIIVRLGEWTLRAACRQGAEMQRQSGRPLNVSVNVSPRQFNQKHFLQVIKSALRESGLRPQSLDLEITEGVLMQYPEDCAKLLGAIRDLGVGVVIDDFGTGYSSLSYFTRFPIDKIKIDQSFVRDLTTDTKDAAVVNAIIAMAKRLHISVIAEGVETAEQQNHLLDEGCDEAQGFLYAKGLSMDELLLNFAKIESAVELDESRRRRVFELTDFVNRAESQE